MSDYQPTTDDFPSMRRPIDDESESDTLDESDALDASSELDTECDYCGRAVRRETAFQRVHRGDDGVEVVPMCRECELGTD